MDEKASDATAGDKPAHESKRADDGKHIPFDCVALAFLNNHRPNRLAPFARPADLAADALPRVFIPRPISESTSSPVAGV